MSIGREQKGILPIRLSRKTECSQELREESSQENFLN